MWVRFSGVALGLMAWLALSACQGADPSVVTLLDGSKQRSAVATQRDGALQFQYCLESVGIQAEVWEVDRNNATVALMVDRAVAWNPIDGVWTSFEDLDGSDMDSASKRFIEEVASSDPHAPRLMVAGVDRSDDYARCFIESGYSAAQFTFDPKDELKKKQLVAQLSNDWAACARAHGYPQISDVAPPVADGYETQPTVELPVTMTPELLESLLKACPVEGTPQDDGSNAYPNIVTVMPEQQLTDQELEHWGKMANMLLECQID